MQEEQIILPPGTVIRERYIIKSLLGKGDSSAIYLVKDQRAKDHLFALKQVNLPSKRALYPFLLECQMFTRLDHQALIHVSSLLKDDKHKRAYILTEYIEGTNLETLRQQRPEQRFSWHETMNIIAYIISALDYLHRQQPPVIHGDIKPTNIIVPKARGRAVLVGLGTAREYDPNVTTTSVRSCASSYRAPEQYGTSIDGRADIYGLGATFYTLITGIVPIDASSRLTQMGNEGIDPLKPVNEVVSTVPVRVAKAIERAMSLDAHERFSSVEQFWEALWSLVEPSPMALASSRPPFTPKQVVGRPATVSVPKQPRAPRTWKWDALWPFTPKQAVERPAAISVPKQRQAPRASKPAVVQQTMEEAATLAAPKQQPAAYAPEPMVAEPAVEEAATVVAPMEVEELHIPEPIVAEPAMEEAATIVAPMELEELQAPEPMVAEPAMEEVATTVTPMEVEELHTPEPIVAEPAVEEAATVVAPMELEELQAPELVVAEPAVEEVATTVTPMEVEELHAPEPVVAQQTVEEVATVSPSKLPEELWAPEPIVEPAVEEPETVSVGESPEELHTPELVVAEPAVEEAVTVVAPMELEELHAPELVVAEPAVEEVATVVMPMELEELHAPELVVAEPAVEEAVTVVAPMELEELHTPELVVEQAVEEVTTVSPSKLPEELWAPEPIVEPAVEEPETILVGESPEELYTPEPVVAQQAVEEPETVSVGEPPEKLYAPEPIVARQAVEEAASVSAPKQPRTPPLKLAIPKRAVKGIAPISIATQRRAPRAWTFAVLLIILVLLIGLGVIANFSFHMPSRSATSTPRHSLTPTVRPFRPTPTSVSIILGGTYKGTLYDLPANVKTSLTLTNVQQSRGKISGYLTVGPGLFGYGPFSGTINTTTKHFQFTVTDDVGNPALFFEGEVQAANSLSGDYYRCNPAQGNPCQRTTVSSLSGDYYRCNPVQGNPCQRTTVGYGVWNVLLSASASGASTGTNPSPGL